MSRIVIDILVCLGLVPSSLRIHNIKRKTPSFISLNSFPVATQWTLRTFGIVVYTSNCRLNLTLSVY
jgi:hypothetical protein